MANDAHILAASKGSCVIAAAGHGKTYLIAEAVGLNTVQLPQLVLTHTHAGVHAIGKKLVELAVTSNKCKVRTISGWALFLASAFPATSGISRDSMPTTEEDWSRIYQGALRILGAPTLSQIVQLSYAGVYVDEYQDCTAAQHELILALAKVVPCRILGDPLQGIFGFRRTTPIDWKRDVSPHFTEALQLTTAWRWKNNPSLSAWLGVVRSHLDRHSPIDLSNRPACVHWVILEESTAAAAQQLKQCQAIARDQNSGTVVAIHGPAEVKPCQWLARRLAGQFSLAEPIDCQDLYQAARTIDDSSGVARAQAVADFACTCLVGISPTLKAAIKQMQPAGQTRTRSRSNVALALAAVTQTQSHSAVLHAFETIRSELSKKCDRREIFDEMLRALRSI